MFGELFVRIIFAYFPTGTKAIAAKNPLISCEDNLVLEISRILDLFRVVGKECFDESMLVKVSEAPKAQKTRERMYKLYLEWAKDQKSALARMLTTAPPLLVLKAVIGKDNLPENGSLCHHSNSDRKTSTFGMVRQSTVVM